MRLKWRARGFGDLRQGGLGYAVGLAAIVHRRNDQTAIGFLALLWDFFKAEFFVS